MNLFIVVKSHHRSRLYALHEWGYHVSMSPTISCIVCAHNEGPRIGSVLQAVSNHPHLSEIIVVDDGSTDETASVVGHFPAVRLISYPVNRGKSHAMAHGLAASKGSHAMLLDADLVHLSPSDITNLAEPILSGRSDVTISLRKNAFMIHHMLGLDFTSGERVIPKGLLQDCLQDVDRLPRFGIESFMNRLIIERKLRVGIVPFPNVSHVRKAEKMGRWAGTVAELRMVRDVLLTISPIEVIRQNYRLLRLSRAGTRLARNAAADDSHV